MLRALEHPLLSSAVRSLIGAVDGGVSSYYVATENLQNQFVMGAYTGYLTEAARALSFANSAEITDQEKKRLGRATAVLAMTASDEVLCRAVNFENEMSSVKPSVSDNPKSGSCGLGSAGFRGQFQPASARRGGGRQGCRPGSRQRRYFFSASASIRCQRSSALNCSALRIRLRKKPVIRRKAATTIRRRPWLDVTVSRV